jgi:hypothetical protein
MRCANKNRQGNPSSLEPAISERQEEEEETGVVLASLKPILCNKIYFEVWPISVGFHVCAELLEWAGDKTCYRCERRVVSGRSGLDIMRILLNRIAETVQCHSYSYTKNSKC